jgi:uncharacterized protein (TIGR03382 family)
MGEGRATTIAFGRVGLAGWALLVLGVLFRRRFVAALGLTAVVADVTVAELGGFKAMNEVGPGPTTEPQPPSLTR